jgi:hypothetical protein
MEGELLKPSPQYSPKLIVPPYLFVGEFGMIGKPIVDSTLLTILYLAIYLGAIYKKSESSIRDV